MLAFCLGPSLIAGVIVWLLFFTGPRLTAWGATAIFTVSAVCSVRIGLDTIMPAVQVLFEVPHDRLFSLGWMAVTGGIVTTIVAVMNLLLASRR